MTIGTLFTDYPALGQAGFDKYDHCSPNERLIQKALQELVPGAGDIGCYGKRDNHAGTAISIHSYGAACDTSYRATGATAAQRRPHGLTMIDWCRENSKELGIQAIHDYMGCRIWRSNRDPHTYPDGWKVQPKDAYGMGQTWGDWIHVEVHAGAWDWTTPIADRLNGAPPIEGPTRPSIGVGSSGSLVLAVQRFLIEKANQGSVVGNPDGRFGPRTLEAWTHFVTWTNGVHPGAMSSDGRVDGIDWNVIAWNDGGWQRLYAAGFPVGV